MEELTLGNGIKIKFKLGEAKTNNRNYHQYVGGHNSSRGTGSMFLKK
jgi:hypothetical protein